MPLNSPAVLRKSRRDGALASFRAIRKSSMMSVGETGRHCTPARAAVSIAHWPKHIDTKGFLGYPPLVESVIPSPSHSLVEAPMIRSMTGYGRAEVAGVRLSLSVECKSLNHRHLDIALRLPRALSAFELDARRLIQGAVQRGRVEVSVGVAPLEGAPAADLTINMAQARAYAALVRRAGDELNLGGPPALQWLLEQPGVITREEQTPLSPEEGWPLLH